MQKNKFMRLNTSFGQWIYNFLLLQCLPIIYTLKGLVVFGFFPAIASTFNIFYQWIAFGKTDLPISKDFKSFYTQYFWQANKLGWGATIAGAVFLLDLYISSAFIQSVVLHSVLLLLFFTYLVICSYLFPVFARYHYEKLTTYIKQAFFISLTSISQSIAILLAVVVLYSVFSYIPFLYLFFGLPLLIGVISWFAIQGMLKAEKMNQAKEGESEEKR